MTLYDSCWMIGILGSYIGTDSNCLDLFIVVRFISRCHWYGIVYNVCDLEFHRENVSPLSDMTAAIVSH